jgi:NAD(P)-dependent dehydrogenase (short-subunit alcohol dehydrogenase family)
MRHRIVKDRTRLSSRIAGTALTVGVGLSLGLTAAAGLGLAFWKQKIARRYQLRGKNVVITGGSRGLGLALAREFLRRGAKVVLLARDPAELQRAEQHLFSADVSTSVCDVTDKDQVDETIRKLGQVDVLVNNAGLIAVGPLETMTIDDFRESLQIHFWAPLYTTLAALPKMKYYGGGRIVNISSIGGKISVPHLLPYCAGKFALGGFSEGLAAEVRKDNILVTTVYPGLMRTGSPRNASFKGKHRAEFTWFSVSDALPLISVGADRAAKQIVNACERGDARLVVSALAKSAVVLHELSPETSTAVLAMANRILPKAGGIGARRAKGMESTTMISPSWITALDSAAALKNNEVA